ncbi:MAG TPA: hypothetical protein VJY62_16180 [Bacteroidia bacterium]|nr:hypothetical protein [Bacteroidia bacterium]
MERVMLIRKMDVVFKELPGFCAYKDYKIKEINNETKTIKAKKGRHIFGEVVELELQLSEVDFEIVNLKIEILKRGITQKELEEEFVEQIYKFF